MDKVIRYVVAGLIVGYLLRVFGGSDECVEVEVNNGKEDKDFYVEALNALSSRHIDNESGNTASGIKAIEVLVDQANCCYYDVDKLKTARKVADIGVASTNQDIEVAAIKALKEISDMIYYNGDKKKISNMVVEVATGMKVDD